MSLLHGSGVLAYWRREARALRFVVLFLALLVFPRIASALTLWTELSMLGYGGLGTGGAVLACRDCDLDSAGYMVMAGGLVGLVVGYQIGSTAERRSHSEAGPGQLPLWGARIGTVSAFATIGALVAAMRINGNDDNREGEDERVFTTYTAIGAGCGLVYEAFVERRLASHRRTPSLSVGPMPMRTAGGPSWGLVLQRSW
jgi:hypothetical protein